MATKQERSKKTLFVATHCPNQWDWARFHATGVPINFSIGNDVILTTQGGNNQIDYIFNPILLRPFSEYSKDGHFARIIINDYHPQIHPVFIGYFNPIKRRAVFYRGQTEPGGLLLFFFWHSLFDQKIELLPSFLDNYLGAKQQNCPAVLDFDIFLEIREVGGELENDSRNKLNIAAIHLIEEYESQTKNTIRQVEFICGHNTDVPTTMKQFFAAKNMYVHLPLVNGASTISDAIKAILNLKLDIISALEKASEIR